MDDVGIVAPRTRFIESLVSGDCICCLADPGDTVGGVLKGLYCITPRLLPRILLSPIVLLLSSLSTLTLYFICAPFVFFIVFCMTILLQSFMTRFFVFTFLLIFIFYYYYYSQIFYKNNKNNNKKTMTKLINIGICWIIAIGLTGSVGMHLMSHMIMGYPPINLNLLRDIPTLLLVGIIYYKWCSKNIHIMFMPMLWGAIFGIYTVTLNCMMLTELVGLWMRCIEGSYAILEFDMCNHEFNNLTVLTLTQCLICSQTIMTVCLHIIYFIMVYDDQMFNKLFVMVMSLFCKIKSKKVNNKTD